MSLSRADFDEFFGAVNSGFAPFAWQSRLLDYVLAEGRWPDVINAPTGSGKSNVVDVHVFANALHAASAGPRVPKRLSVVVNRRAIVDQHLRRAQSVQAALAARDSPVLRDMADLLAVGDAEPLLVVSLRGGLPNDPTWLDDPRRCAVIAATPDMWGSRALFSGYGSSWKARPREAGFLGYDIVFVLDEAHLNRQLEDTARSMAAMVTKNPIGEVPGLQVVGTTATPTGLPDGLVGVELADLDVVPDGALSRRLRRPKLLRPRFELPAKANPESRASLIAREALAVRQRIDALTGGFASRPVLCVVNDVKAAALTASKLGKAVGDNRVATWVGPMRPMDLTKMQERHPGLLDASGEVDIDYLVATQTVEVGVDLDCVGLVTELAPGSALSQRFGRVNRLGLRECAEVVVVAPADEPTSCPPYETDDLLAAYEWLQGLGDGADVCPWNLTKAPAPQQRLRRQLTELTLGDVRWLAGTSIREFYPTNLDFFVRDDLEGDRASVQVVARRKLPEDASVARGLLRETPVVAGEAFTTRIAIGRELVKKVFAAAELQRAFVWRDDELLILMPDPAENAAAITLQAGDTIIFDAEHPLTTGGIISEDPTDPAGSLAVRCDPDDPQPEDLCVDVLGPLDEESGRRLQTPRLRLADEVVAEPDAEGDVNDRVHDALGLAPNEQVILPPPDMRVDDCLPWIVISPIEAARQDPELRQEWSASRAPVTLEQHQSSVAARARLMSIEVGMPEFGTVMDLAGAHHDDGKADLRFQIVALGARGEPALAKSRKRSPQQVRRDKHRGGLPTGWRHEQLSAAYVIARLEPGDDRDLVARLVGTSHGHGRPFFPHGADTLRPSGEVPPDLNQAIDGLFSAGDGWDEVLDSTVRRFGYWGCAFLEAVFRAADCQVSREGS